MFTRIWRRAVFAGGFLIGLVASGCATTVAPESADLEAVHAPEEAEATPAPEPVAVTEAATDRMVGIGYSVWFPPQRWPLAWDEPRLGRYKSDSPVVIRQHAEWLRQVGVDFIVIDWSSNIGEENRAYLQPLETATRRVFEEYAAFRDAPRICLMLGINGDPDNIANGNLQQKVDEIHVGYAANPRFSSLFQRYLGKPLLLVYAWSPSPWQEGVPEWNDDRFTVRWVTGFIGDQPALQGEAGENRFGYWSWWERTPQGVAMHDGQPECMPVSAAYPGPFGWGKEGTMGRRDGQTFHEQWLRAHEVKPHFVLVNSFNEWAAPEEDSVEFSNDLEPSRSLGRYYLDLLAEEIALYKGIP